MTPLGLLNVNKPTGRTSREVVDQVERVCRPAKAGHTGTLDPLASGVLVICVGQATRLVPYIQQMRKHYQATFVLGLRSETDDTEGVVTASDDVSRPDLALIEQTLPQFLGDIQQRPPAHSAIKVAGRRAYALARQGKLDVLPARAVTIHQLRVLHYDYPHLHLEVECGSGTYVRALGRDLAASLGTSAVMAGLVRLAIGSFRIEDSVAPDELTAATLAGHLQPMLAAVANLPRIDLDDQQLAELRHGRPIAGPTDCTAQSSLSGRGEWAAVDPGGCLAAILFEKHPGQLWPRMNLAAPASDRNQSERP